MTEKPAVTDLVTQFKLPEVTRWVDVSAAGMRLYIAVYKGGKRLVMENGDKMPEVMELLKFERAANGFWFHNDASFEPKLYTNNIPGALLVRAMPTREVLVDLRNFELAPGEDENSPRAKLARLTTQLADTAPVLLGFNKASQPVHQGKDGKRYLENGTKSIAEGSGPAALPGHYLRAVDSKMLEACADAYLVTLSKASPDAEFVKPENFMKTIGLKDGDTATFADAVSSAVIRAIMKNRKETLRQRFDSAVAYKETLERVGLKLPTSLEAMIISRRLMGLDRDIRGESVFRIGGADKLFEAVMPESGVRQAEDAPSATLCVNFASSAKEAADTLDKLRPAKSKTVIVLDVENIKKARAITEAFAKNNHIEGAAFVSPAAGGPRIIVSLVATEAESGEYALQTVESDAELWTWASTIASERSHAIETFKAGLATDKDFTAASAFVMDNSYQVAYHSASKLGQSTSLMPKELAAATRTALDRIISNYKDVDQKVAYECGYPIEKLGDYLVPEQIDGVALLINAEERGRGGTIGDGTGVGKGRQIMTMVRRAVLKGQRCVVFTESLTNLGDLQRDAKHLDSLQYIKPLVMNEGDLIDESTDEPFEVMDRGLLDKAIQNMEWPEGVQVIYTTYSQFNKTADSSEKTRWLKHIVDERVSLFFDEAHNAASRDSNVSDNVEFIKQNAATVVNASATYAPQSKNIAFYKEMFPSDINTDELTDMMNKGGEPFQEVVSDMLVSDGVFFRREGDLSQIEFQQRIDTAKMDENRVTADRLSIIISEMAQLSTEVEKEVTRNNQGRNANVMKKTAIGSPLYLVTRLFNAAIMADFTCDEAIKELQEGNKPAFLVENTIAELLEEARAGDGMQPTFRHVLSRVLNQMVNVTVSERGKPDADRGKVDMSAANQTIADSHERIQLLIGSFPEIPASVIDVIKNRITAAGYKIGEITGRSLEINAEGKVVPRKERDRTAVKNAYNSGGIDCVIMNGSGATGMDLHAGRRFKDQRRRVLFEVQAPAAVLKQIQAFGRYSRRDQSSAPKIVFMSSGLPYEARLAAMRNQKLRRLSANVQSNRDSIYLMGNIPDLLNSVGDAVITKYAEMRPDLLRRLVLTEKWSQRTKLIDVASDSLVARSEQEEAGTALVAANGTEVPAAQAREGFRNGRADLQAEQNRSANELLSRLALLPCREQERILHELTAEYEMHIAELDSLGSNPLRPREFDGTVHIKNSKLFEGSIDSGANSAFEAPMYLMNSIVERDVEPMRSEALLEVLETAAPRYESIVTGLKEVLRNRDRYLEHYLKDGHVSVDDAVAKGDPRISGMIKDLEHLEMALAAFEPGRQISFVNADGDAKRAIIASIETPWEGMEHLMSSYRMKIAIPGSEKIKEYGLETVLRNPGVTSFTKEGKLEINTKAGLDGDAYETILDEFDNAKAKELTSSTFLVGNVFRAVRYATQFKLGSLVSFIDSTGRRHRGVHINKQAERKLSQIAVRVEDFEMIRKALMSSIEVNSSPTGTGRNLVITPLGGDTWSIRLPEPYARRGVKQWPSEDYRMLFETMVAPDFDQEEAERNNMAKTKMKKAMEMRAIISGQRQLDNVLNVVRSAGFNTFYVSSKHRAEVDQPESKDVQWQPENAGAMV
jgi:hypothetical protein